MKRVKKIAAWFFCILFLLCLFVYFIATRSHKDTFTSIWYRYLSADHDLPMAEHYVPVGGTGDSLEFRLLLVNYRENPKADGYDHVIWFRKNKEPFVTNIVEDIKPNVPIEMSGVNKNPPFALYSTNEFLTPAYHHAVDAHTRSHEGKAKDTAPP